MSRWRRSIVLCWPVLLSAAQPAFAQSTPAPDREVVLPIENVRFEYAQVLAVRPVQQVLRTTSTERVCSEPGNPNALVPESAINARRAAAIEAGQTPPPPVSARHCRMAPVVRQYQRTIAYDVDYVYRGSKFRTRMGRDPGNRLRIRISIAPAPLE